MMDMNKIVMGAVGICAVGVVSVVVAKAVSHKGAAEPEEISDISEETQETTETVEKEDESFIERIKTAATKKVVRILAWVVLHQNQINAVGTIVGLVGGVLGVVNAVKEYTLGNKLHEKLDQLCAFEQEYRSAWNKALSVCDENWDRVFKALPPEGWQWVD